MIELKNVSKTYSTKAGAVVAIDGIDLKFDDCGLVFVVGKSGSGKSTLLNLIGALDIPDSGEIVVDGQTTSGYRQSDYDAYRNYCVGFVFQEYNLLDELNVSENIALALELQGSEKCREKVRSILSDLDLEEYKNRKVNTLSGGQRQRVAIARALVKSPSIILADEPTGALDSETGNDLYTLLKKLSRERLVIVVSHDNVAASEFADRIIELKDGKVFADNNLTPVSKHNKSLLLETDEPKTESHHCLAQSEDASADIKDSIVNPKERKGLSLKHTFKLGAKVFVSKKIRLAVSILLCAFAFSVLSLSINIACYDKAATAARSLAETEDYISYKKEVFQVDNDYWTWYSSESYFNDDEITKIQEQLGRDVLGVVPFGKNGESSQSRHEINTVKANLGTIDYSGISGAVYLEERIREAADFKIYGRIPTVENEVAVTEYAYQLYKKFGYDTGRYFSGKYYEGITKKINSHDDLFGQTIVVSFKNNYVPRELTICGIIDTNFNYDKYKFIDDSNGIKESNLKKQFTDEMNSGWHGLVFLSEELINQEKGEYSYALTVFPDNKKDLVKIAKLAFDEQDGVRYALANHISLQIDYADEVLIIVKDVALYAGLAIGAFAVILLCNYISATASDNKKMIGIIRALGGGAKETIKIFVIQSLLVAICVYITTSIISLIGFEAIGSLMKTRLNIPIKIVYFDSLQSLITLGLSVTASAVASFVPVYIMTTKKPLDLIRS